ncbi:MAG TPA: hypothetical protein ENI23_02620 [bacterium]|nr:hypothetical protein [bacterium]
MQTAEEIKSAIKNIRYYSQIIYELSKKQFNIDCEQGQHIGVNLQPGTIRFDSLGAMGAACSWLNTYCSNIEANLKTAIEQDKLLHHTIIEEKENEII